MKNYLRSTLVMLSLMGFVAIAVMDVYAVKYPKKIKWAGSTPTAFVSSLYRGVFGRPAIEDDQPHFSNHVAWVAANNTAAGRLKMFYTFVGAREYYRRGLHQAPRDWSIYRRYSGRYIRYSVARNHPPGATYMGGPYNKGVAWALTYHYRAFYGYRG